MAGEIDLVLDRATAPLGDASGEEWLWETVQAVVAEALRHVSPTGPVAEVLRHVSPIGSVAGALRRVSPIEPEVEARRNVSSIGPVAEALRNLSPIVPVAAQSTTNSSSGGSSKANAGGGSGGSSSNGIGDITEGVLGFLGQGLPLQSLISGVFKLFGGGDAPSEPTSLLKFALPPSVHVNAGVSRENPGAAFAVDSGQGGLPRPVMERAASQITVNVQAMDSQSFMDRSGDIARAVRQAMLESSVLNDVVREA